MKDISLHILDIAQNSISAGASMVRIKIHEDQGKNILILEISDNGRGMTEEEVLRVSDPYFTTRTTRKVGMGIPLLKHNAEQADGRLEINSQPGKGTEIAAFFLHSHIDRPPLGDLAGVIRLLVAANPELDFIYSHSTGKEEFVLDTREIRLAMGDIPLNHPELLDGIREMITENLREIQVI